MILIPEIETVVILVPRTGSGSLRKAVCAAYPKALPLYRHMEADGVPQGYERWRKVGVVRHPLDRLWSLYKFLQRFDGAHSPAYIQVMRQSVTRPFEDWVLNNEVTFTSPYDRAGSHYYPFYACRNPMPENQKSQFLYLRPDLGTQVYHYGDLGDLADDLGLESVPVAANVTYKAPRPEVSQEVWDHLERFHGWDLSQVA